MEIDTMVRDYKKLTSLESSMLLCYIGVRLTATFRLIFLMDSRNSIDVQKAKDYNEMFHKIFGQMSSVIVQDSERYPDDLFVTIIVGMAEEGGFGDEFAKAWNDALDYVTRQSEGGKKIILD